MGRRQAGSRIFEDITHFAHFDTMYDLSRMVVDGHACAFLAAMLQGGQGQCEIAAHVDVVAGPGSGCVDAYDSACVVQALHVTTLLSLQMNKTPFPSRATCGSA